MAPRAGIRALLAIITVEGAALTVGEVTAAASEVVQPAIIGGELTDPGEYAATGALVRGRTYRCTATLIAPDVAVTAAHCLVDQGWGDFSFTLDADLTDSVDDLIPILAFHQHPNYEAGGAQDKIGQRNDVGVIILEEPIEGIEVERLGGGADQYSLGDGSELSLCGYGRDNWSNQRTAGIKRDAVVFVDDMTDWELQGVGEDPQPCKGDSGGPLFAPTADGRRIAALVSRSVGGETMCASGAIYTRMEPYIDWVERASLDRDNDGCAAAAGGGGGAWIVLLGWLVMARRRRARL